MERWLWKLVFVLPLVFIVGTAAAQETQESPPEATEATTIPDGVAPAAAENVVEEELLGASSTDAPPNFNKRMLTIEEKVNSLKEQVFRSKATLQLLKEIVIQGSSSGARAVLWHSNELGSSYSLNSISYYLDGQPIYSKVAEDDSLDKIKEFKLHDGPIPAGNHTLSVSMVLRGNGFGIFSYVNRYTFNVQSSYAFAVEDGKNCEIWIRTKDRKGIGRSFVERPWIEYDIHCTQVAGQSEQ